MVPSSIQGKMFLCFRGLPVVPLFLSFHVQLYHFVLPPEAYMFSILFVSNLFCGLPPFHYVVVSKDITELMYCSKKKKFY